MIGKIYRLLFYLHKEWHPDNGWTDRRPGRFRYPQSCTIIPSCPQRLQLDFVRI